MAFYDGKDFTENELALIAATVGLSPGDKRFKPFCRDTREAARSYLSNLDAELRRPRAAEVRKNLIQFRRQLQAFRNAANKFQTAVECLDQRTFDALTSADLRVFNLEDDLAQLRRAVDGALRSIGPDKGGPGKSRKSVQQYLLELSAIFEDVTDRRARLPTDRKDNKRSKGEERFRGKFFYFVKTCLEILKDPVAGKDTRLVAQMRVVSDIRRRRLARKDFELYPTLPNSNRDR
jgi:hypothetical protein